MYFIRLALFIAILMCFVQNKAAFGGVLSETDASQMGVSTEPQEVADSVLSQSTAADFGGSSMVVVPLVVALPVGFEFELIPWVSEYQGDFSLVAPDSPFFDMLKIPRSS